MSAKKDKIINAITKVVKSKKEKEGRVKTLFLIDAIAAIYAHDIDIVLHCSNLYHGINAI